jgi:hypothetical protein
MLSLKKRFWSKVNKDGPLHSVLKTKCWLWTACIMSTGYGAVGIGRLTYLAHRVAWFIAYGRWPEPCALHKCDIRQCVRPSHLFEGTKKDNNIDAREKGRGIYPVGEANGKSKLTAKKVEYIRRSRKTQREIARILGVSHSTVGLILRGETWRIK